MVRDIGVGGEDHRCQRIDIGFDIGCAHDIRPGGRLIRIGPQEAHKLLAVADRQFVGTAVQAGLVAGHRGIEGVRRDGVVDRRGDWLGPRRFTRKLCGFEYHLIGFRPYVFGAGGESQCSRDSSNHKCGRRRLPEREGTGRIWMVGHSPMVVGRWPNRASSALPESRERPAPSTRERTRSDAGSRGTTELDVTVRGRQPVAIRRSVVAGSAAGYVGTGGFGVLTSAGVDAGSVHRQPCDPDRVRPGRRRTVGAGVLPLGGGHVQPVPGVLYRPACGTGRRL